MKEPDFDTTPSFLIAIVVIALVVIVASVIIGGVERYIAQEEFKQNCYSRGGTIVNTPNANGPRCLKKSTAVIALE